MTRISRTLLPGLMFVLSIPLHNAMAQQSETVSSASETSLGTFAGAKPTEYPPWFEESFLEFADDISEAWFKIFHTQSLFDYVHSESYRTEPSFQRYISARADHLIEQGIDVDIWN